MPSTEVFDLNTLKNLSPNDSKKYITKFFVPLNNGNHAMLVDGQYIIKDDQEIKRSYFNRMSKELSNYYFKDYCEVKGVVYEFGKPLFYEDKINLCPDIKHTYEDNYIITEDIKQKRDLFLSYIFEVLCSSKEDSYQYILCWISNVIKGNKNTSCLYLKGGQGMGKTTLFELLNNHIIGKNLCLETGSDPIRTKFNEILGGKILVAFEELENFSKAEWESISSTLKRLITSSRINLQNKCTKSYESNNINNYMLMSNNDAIKDDDGRRYFILDISPHRVGDNKYWNNIYKSCFNDKVGKALYQYFYEIDVTDFNPQIMPLTQNKIDSQTKRLDSVYKFIKENYILHSKSIKISCNELYSEYKYSPEAKYKPCAKEDFHKKLLDIGFIKVKKSTSQFYDMNFKDLLNIATKRNWISEYDEFSTADAETSLQNSPQGDADDTDGEISDLDVGIKKKISTTKTIKRNVELDFSDN
jgi:hypothetical protein